MIKVSLFSRDKALGNFSMEELFKRITEQLADRVDFNHVYTKKEENLFANIFRLSKKSAKVNHITGDINFVALGLPKRNTILTVHDLGHFENTLTGWRKWLYKLVWLDLPFRKVGYITCISNFTKSKIIEYTHINPSKISVVYNPYPNEFKYHEKTSRNEYPVILQIGSGHNKNIEKLIMAVKDFPCSLVFIGKLLPKHLDLLVSYKIKFKIFSNLNYQEIYQQYVDCDMLYFASTYEGFGMPIVEAQAVGRPVITSTVAAMPEIAGDGAFLVDPNSVSEILNAIKLIWHDNNLRKDLVEKGLKNIHRFKIEIIANAYFELYQTIWKK